MKKAMLRALCLALLVAVAVAAAPGAHAQDIPPEVAAEAYVVMDVATGQILVSKNAHLAEFPASITKIMTLALTLENVDMATVQETRVPVSDAAVDALIPRASMIALGRGEEPTVNDLLYATMIASANDASHVLAEHVAGSMDDFALMMNEKAAALGLADSNFTNPSGQPDDNHYTSAYDMANITRWALGVPGFRDIFGADKYHMGPTNSQPGGRVFHGNNMIMQPGSSHYCDGVQGSKTGYTDDALYTLVTTARRGDTELICVVLKCPYNEEKYTSTNALLDYCFNNFSRVQFTAGDFDPVMVPVYGGGGQALGQIEVRGTGAASYLLHNSLSAAEVEVRCEVPEKYVMGQPFAPMMYLSLAGSHPGQEGAQLAALPMTWSGLDKVLAANTSETMWQRMAEDTPVMFWLLLAVPVLLVCLVVGRIVYVKHKRNKRRQKRLAAARAQMPISIAGRPEPPAPPRHVVVGSNAMYLDSREQPRRVGQARHK